MKSLLVKVGVVLVAFALAGCASKQWAKPAFNPDEYKQDCYLCEREANILASGEAAALSRSVNPLLVHAIAKKRFFNNCMEARGYQQFKSDKERELIESLNKTDSDDKERITKRSETKTAKDVGVSGPDWKLYDATEDYFYYYDQQSMTRPSENIARVWQKLGYTQEAVMDWVKEFGKKYENISYSMNLTEINCVKKTIQSLSISHYDHKGGVIEYINSRSEMYFIIPGSVGESLYKQVCK